jgi:hypothetical protein
MGTGTTWEPRLNISPGQPGADRKAGSVAVGRRRKRRNGRSPERRKSGDPALVHQIDLPNQCHHIEPLKSNGRDQKWEYRRPNQRNRVDDITSMKSSGRDGADNGIELDTGSNS